MAEGLECYGGPLDGRRLMPAASGAYQHTHIHQEVLGPIEVSGDGLGHGSLENPGKRTHMYRLDMEFHRYRYHGVM